MMKVKLAKKMEPEGKLNPSTVVGERVRWARDRGATFASLCTSVIVALKKTIQLSIQRLEKKCTCTNGRFGRSATVHLEDPRMLEISCLHLQIFVMIAKLSSTITYLS